jgi:DNA-binding XRE family transcriptional regulator
MTQKTILYIVRARLTLGWTQREMAENLGSSQRTVARWESGQSTFHVSDLTKLAQRVYPVDRELANDLVTSAGQTLVGLGIQVPPPPPPPAPVLAPPPPPPARATALPDLIDCVVCSVADASDVSPREVRPMVLLALRRAFEVGLDLGAATRAKLLETAPVVVLD